MIFKQFKFNIPNLLSLARVVLLPLFIYLLYLKTTTSWMWALIVFAFASFTDLLDGWSARKLNLQSEFGEFIDPLADKILVVVALAAVIIMDPYEVLDIVEDSWMVLVIVGRDFLITFMRYLAINKGTPLKTSKFGKIKTAFQMGSITSIIAIFILRGFLINKNVNVVNVIKDKTIYDIISSNISYKWLVVAPYLIMILVTLLTAFSGVRYLFTNFDLIVSKKTGKK